MEESLGQGYGVLRRLYRDVKSSCGNEKTMKEKLKSRLRRVDIGSGLSIVCIISDPEMGASSSLCWECFKGCISP